MSASLSICGDQGTLRGKSLLIFDFDGTLADTTPLHAAAFTEVLAPLGIAVDYSCIAGLKTSDAVRLCLAGGGLQLDNAAVDELVEAKQKSVRRMIARGLAPLPGVDEFLRRARLNFRLAMVTSGSRGTISLSLKRLGYVGWFDPLVCADDVTHAKPHPEGFLLALRRAGISAESALVFEDSQAGFDASTAAGLSYVDVVRSSWNKLVELLP